MEINKSPRGRPPTGRTKDSSLYIRCRKEQKDRIRAMIGELMKDFDGFTYKANPNPITTIQEARAVVMAEPGGGELKSQIKALLEDVDRLTKELEEERAKVKRALELDLDEKGKMGWRLYFKLKEGTGKSEFDQS